MLLQKQPNHWSCLPTAFAIATEMPVSKIIEMIGHDGGERVFSGKRPERSFHIGEISILALRLGFSLTPVFNLLTRGNRETGQKHHQYLDLNKLLQEDFREYRSIMCGIFPGGPHAVAHEGGMIYDPNGTSYPYDSKIITVEQFWVVRSA